MHFQMLKKIIILQETNDDNQIEFHGHVRVCVCVCDQIRSKSILSSLLIRIVNDYLFSSSFHTHNDFTSFDANGKRTPIEPERVV